MTIRTKDQNTYIHGSWNVLCDVCGFKFKSCDIQKRWDGLMVCQDDWEPRHPSDFFKIPKERYPIPYTRPDDVEVGGTDINGNPIPPPAPYFINFIVEIL